MQNKAGRCAAGICIEGGGQVAIAISCVRNGRSGRPGRAGAVTG